MGTITLSVPDDLKSRMDSTDWINWSSVARKAFSEALKDLEEMHIRKHILEVSGIHERERGRCSSKKSRQK